MSLEAWRIICIILVAVGTAGGAFLTITIDSIKDNAAKAQQKQLTEKIDGLTQGSEKLQDKLKPFENLASKMYPGIETDAALGKLYRELQDVKEKTQRLSPREITPEQKQTLIELLKSSGLSRFPIMIAVRLLDSESQQFGEQLRKIFAEAGWDVESLNKGFLDDVTGDFAINITNATQTSTANQITSILNQVGFKCMLEHIRLKSMPGVIAGHIYIFVGSKKQS